MRMICTFVSIVLIVVQVSNGLHHSMSSLELKHFFGTEQKDKVPQYFIDNPQKKVINHDRIEMDFVINGVKEKFVLRNKPHLFSEGFHMFDGNVEVSSNPLKNCIYEGESASRNGTYIGIVGCGSNVHGMVITNDGDFHLIQSHQSGRHVIHKRSLDSIEHECQFDINDDPYPEDREESAMRSSLMRLVRDIRKAEQKRDPLTVELAVFADDAMWQHFRKIYGNKAEDNMHTFIMAVVNNIDVLYTQRLLQPRINVKIVRYEILKSIPQMMHSKKHSNGDVDKLLDAFCQYQNEINPQNDDDPRHWDHALLFSGYDLHRNGIKTIAGYAPVKGMCSGVRSCTINEGLDFGSVFVVTHEMGHSLGMYHDGDNECDLRCCIMSPSVGSGKTHWSRCSVNEMATFVGHLGEDFRPPNCLQDVSIAEQKVNIYRDTEPPGQLFTLDDQCEIFHGECWKHELKDGQVLQNVCQMVWCGNGEGVIRTAHPALEGTYCGFGMICRQGTCINSNQFMSLLPGGWSTWNDRPGQTCGGRCAPCEIRGQIRVMRSIRQCNNPSPNNGGAQCQGDEARGLVCHKDVCNGESVENYATRICTKLKRENAIPNTILSGEGMQFEQAMCKVWCLITGTTNIRTVSNFPDGTPCGAGQYCIKGECRSLLCGGTTVAYSESDCPPNTPRRTTSTPPPNTYKPPTVHSVDQQSLKTNSYKEQKKAQFLNEWSGWSEWSDCVTYDCRSPGLKVRVRRCLAGICAGALRERISCTKACTENDKHGPTTTVTQQTFRNRFIAPLPSGKTIILKKVERWGTWSACSVTCGIGQKIRKRENCIGQDCAQIGSCTMPSCSPEVDSNLNNWTDWSEWSDCSVTCGSGIRNRKRACFASICRGRDSDVKRCDLQECSKNKVNVVNSMGSWTGWSAWSACSTKCGTGNRSRKRRCYQGVCAGNEEEKERCFGNDCSRL